MRKKTENEFIEAVLKHRLVLDIGGGQPWVSGWIHKKYGNILVNKAHCVDFLPQNKPHIVADIKYLPFKDISVGGIICNAVLEHVDKPFIAISELHRVLDYGGELFLYVPWVWPYHSSPKDYFRYSVDGIKSLCDMFSSIQIAPADFDGLAPNRILCGLSFLIPPVPWLRSILYRVVGMPLYWATRASLYFALLIAGKHLVNKSSTFLGIGKLVDHIMVDGFTHGYNILCRK
jgi:ubiquinone/menaquinone biosynthesis C-methylase UbiE